MLGQSVWGGVGLCLIRGSGQVMLEGGELAQANKSCGGGGIRAAFALIKSIFVSL